MTESAVSAASFHVHPLLADVERRRVLRTSEPSFAAELRRRGAEHFAELGFPTPRLEEWRFTNLKPIVETPYAASPGSTATPAIEEWCVPGAHRLVLVDGQFVPELSSIDGLPRGTVLTSLSEALARCPELVEPHLGRLAATDGAAFTALNSALFRDGAFLWLPTGSAVERPIQILSVVAPSRRPVAHFPRHLLLAGPSSSATVVESYGGSAGAYLSCPVTEFVIGDNAHLRHVRLQEEGRDAHQVAVQSASLERDASFVSQAISLGGALFRQDVHARLEAEGAHLGLHGLYMTEGRQHVDHHLLVRHAAPHGTSRQLYKGILDGSSRGVFSGRIMVDPGAQKTNAEQSNRNLLLSDGAMVNSNPQLEILADDVRCTHGSTVGRLDEDAVFYLRSRGLDRAAAESLLTYAFASEILEKVPVDAVRERIKRLLISRLPRGELVRDAF